MSSCPNLVPTEDSVLSFIRRFDESVYNRNISAALSCFEPAEDTVIIGSEAGETGKGPEGIRTFFEDLFSRPMRFSFRWDETTVSTHSDLAWVYLGGSIVYTSAAGVHAHPYRRTGILRRHGQDWRWVQFHSSEPAG